MFVLCFAAGGHGAITASIEPVIRAAIYPGVRINACPPSQP
jgi:hypothetical protein